MRSSRGDHDNSNRVSSSSSSKSLSSSPSPSSLHSSILRNPRRKTIEEAWNNMNSTCIHHNNNTSSSTRVEELSPLPKTKTTSTFNNLQNKDTQTHKQQPKLPILIPRFSTTQVHPPPPPPPPPQPQPQPINLNIVCDDDNIDEHPLGSNPIFNHNNLSFIDYSKTSFVSTLNTSHLLHQSFGSTPFSDNNTRASDDNINCSIDRSRHKRLINNRGSAARSRARKQAHSNELELEVARLMEENAMLRKQQKQLYFAAAENQHPKKTTLQRTSTAPF